jgi:hypothetical protein
VAEIECTPVSVAAAWSALAVGEKGFAIPSRRDQRPQVIVEIIPIEAQSGRSIYWVVFSDGDARIMDGRATVFHVSRLSNAA